MQSMVAVLLCVLCSALSTGVVSASVVLKPEVIQPSHNHTFTFGYTGGAPFCTQCGSPGAYACSNQPNWVATQTFRDNNHPNSVVLGVTAMLSGSYACTSPVAATTLAVSLNGVIIDIVSVDGKQNCKCNTCDGYVTLSKATPLGWPTYSNDGTVPNNVTVSVYTGSICLNSLTLILSYGAPTYPLQTAYKVIPWGNGGTQSSGICGLTYYTSGAGTINFSDFLPENSILYSVDVQVFGVYFVSSSGYCTNATVSMALNNFAIGDTLTLAYPRQNLYSSNVVTTPCRTYGCDGKWLFSMAQLYQNGVPSYNYQSSNSLVFHGAYQTKMALAALWFYYLPKSSAPLLLN